MRFSAPLWQTGSTGAPAEGPSLVGAWCFVTLPLELSEEVRDLTTGVTPSRGFGSVRVEVTVGRTNWRTSVFPDAGSGCYVLPVKKMVRQHEDLEPGDLVDVSLRIEPEGQPR
jgi:hypothetical protein